MHAIVDLGGKQYRVAPGDVIRVEKLDGDVGSEVELPVKTAFQEDGEMIACIAKPLVLGARTHEVCRNHWCKH